MNAGEALCRALLTACGADNVSANIGNIRSREWASATFSGMRHEVPLRLSGSGAAALVAGLAERQFDLPGHILIDVAATDLSGTGEERELLVEALTVAAD